MKTKLIFIILVLVILPTAILSLVAGRSLRNRELVLEHQRRTAAKSTIQEISGRTMARLEDDLKQINAAMSECLSRSTRFRDLEAAAMHLRNSGETAKQVFLFMSPWGFLYPDVSDRERQRLRPGWDFVPKGEQEGTGYDRLLAALREKTAATGPLDTAIWLTVENTAYCFMPLGDRKSLYAGYEVDPDGFSGLLSDVIAGASAGVFLLLAEQPGPARQGEIIVTDSFGPSSDLPEASQPKPQRKRSAELGDREQLASGTLPFPFDYITIKAFLRDPAGAKREEKFQERLYAWGILLLAAGICIGAWLVIREAAVEIQRAKARSDFLIGVSHDLRTPVSSMKVLAESLYLDHVPDPGKQKKFHGAIVKECERLADIIERVLFFMREEHKAIKYSFEEVDIGRFIKSVIQPFIERTAGKVKVDLAIADNLPPAKIDPEAMGKVILNLLDNAVKYSRDLRSREYGLLAPRSTGAADYCASAAQTTGLRTEEDGQPVSIIVTVEAVSRRGRPWVGISVRDRGIGIEPSQQKKIFDEYYRAPVEETGGMAGIGLGLSLCRKIVKAHKGRIELESTPGKGSVFTILLPALGKE